MAEEKETVSLYQKQILEIEQIAIDKDKDAAFKFLVENIYKPIKKRKEAHCKPQF